METSNWPQRANAKDHPTYLKYLRLPKAGTRCPYTGLSRSILNGLILPTAANGYRPPVQSKRLRQPGKDRGIRLIVFDSLMDYLGSLPENDGGNIPHELAD
jgi:hypothetical protein